MADEVTVTVGVPEVDELTERVRVPLPVREGVTVELEHAVAVFDRVAVAHADPVAVTDPVGDTDVESVFEGDDDDVAVTVMVTVSELEAVADGLPDWDGECDEEELTDKELVAVVEDDRRGDLEKIVVTDVEGEREVVAVAVLFIEPVGLTLVL